MTQCGEISLLLATRRNLTLAQEQQVQAHLAECPTCAAQWDLEQNTSRLLQLIHKPPQPAVEQVVLTARQQLNRDLARGSWWRWARPLASAAAVGALVVAALVLGSAVGNQQARDDQSPLSVAQQSPAVPSETPAAGVRAAPATPTLAASPTAATATPQPTSQPLVEDVGGPDDATADQEAQAVRQTVEQFGRQLRQVPLLAPNHVLEPAMQKHYGTYVSADLLEVWIQAPLQAPGRRTSSPWPERIEVGVVQRIRERHYVVEGEIIEVVNQSPPAFAVVNSIPITLGLEQREDRWLITTYRQQPANARADIDASDATTPEQIVQTRYLLGKTLQEVRDLQGPPREAEQTSADGEPFAGIYRYYLSDGRTELEFRDGQVQQCRLVVQTEAQRAFEEYSAWLQEDLGAPTSMTARQHEWSLSGFKLTIIKTIDGFKLIATQA